TISQHLKELKNTGIIQGTIEGKSVCYCINEVVWKQMQQEFNTFFNQDVNISSCCK
ncbi:MAG: ArsR/SmtB family transcription factor, partial [Sphingobacterium sp.]